MESPIATENVYQKPLLFSKQLPYSEKLETEANEMFDRIKKNLSLAVQRRELWPGAMYWSYRLQSYLSVYGLHFTKQDHIHLIKLLYQLIIIPNIDSGLLHAWCALLCRLLRKVRFLSPKELQLPWRPLYDLISSATQSKFKRLGMKTYSERTISSVRQVIGHSRCYFPIESTQEMLDEWRPLLCPFDTSMIEAARYFNEFLPTLAYTDDHDKTFKLWLDELMRLWLIPGNHYLLEDNWVRLFVRLANDNIGYIDWSPYMEQIFNRILNSFNLPMGPPEFQVKSSSKDGWNGDKSATLVVALLGGGSQTQQYLNRLLIALESYYHPSNIGIHTKKLMTFLKNLTYKFVLRVKRERNRKPSWEPPIPTEHQLTEEDIDSFVQSLLPVLRLALFTRRGIYEVALCIKNLSELRPNMILPELMERTYAALETLTEPHQVISTLSCVTAVVRTLVSDERFPEGRVHIFDLLRLALPGIDPNDVPKMLSSSLLISALANLILFVDCSPAVGNVEMTEIEADVCSLTSQFEDIVVQVIDRYFLLIESSAMNQGSADIGRIINHAKRDPTELLMGAGITGSIHSILTHCSPEIFKVAFDKLFRFATSNVFANEAAGRMCGEMCGTACRIDPHTVLKKFIPHITSRISEVLEDSEQIDAENPDIELVWNLQLLSTLLLVDGHVLTKYGDELMSCLKQCIHLKSKKASKHAAVSIHSILYSLAQIYPVETNIVATPLDLPPKDHLYIRDWGVSCKIDNANIIWHCPNEESLAFLNRLLEEFLRPELQALQDFMDGKKTFDRDALCQSLELVELILKGITSILPNIDGPVVDGCISSVVSLERLYHITSKTHVSLSKDFTRRNLSEFVHKLTRHIMTSCEDDTKSLLALVSISKLLLVNFGVNRQEFEGRHQGLNQIKLTMTNNLHGKKKLVRPLIIARCHLLHELRMKEHSLSLIKDTHLLLMEDLSDLSVSSYPEVRVLAQQSLNASMEDYLSACRLLLPRFLPYLKYSDTVTHEQFKGSLYVMVSPLVTQSIVRNWDIAVYLLPQLVQADHSEKPSILALISHLHNNIQKLYDNFSINYEVTNESVATAEMLCSPIGSDELASNLKRLSDLNSKRYSSYERLIVELVIITEAQHDLTQWRFTEITIKLLVMLIKRDVPYPLRATKLLVNCLVNDSLSIRKVGVFAVTLILQKLKRPHKRIIIDPEQLSTVKIHNPLHTTPGEREDNKWLCLMEADAADNESDWNSNKGNINKTKHGFYCYPKSLEGYAPVSEQPSLNRSVEEMTEDEAFIYNTFTNGEFVSKVISFLSLEENKGNDQFDTHRSNMFKNLFRNYGSNIVELFRPHLEKLAIDSQESGQRCSCEIIAGLVRAMKHWSYDMVMQVRDWLEPLLVKVLMTVQPETADDWYQCFSDISADRDPKRINWLFKILAKQPLIGDNGSFVDSSRLSIIQATIAQQQWRVPYLLKEVSEYLFTQLDHPFKNVREKIGSLISNLYLMDISNSGFQILYSPSLSDMLKLFSKRIPDAQTLTRVAADSKELKICKTAMNVIINSYQPSAVQFYELFSKLVPLTSYEGDDEIGYLIIMMCKQLSRRELNPNMVSPILESLKKANSAGLWKVKIPVLLILQVLVFCNLFTFSSVTDELCDLLLSLVEDSQIEVREVASSTVSGLIRCGFVTHSKVKRHFTKKSRTKINHKTKNCKNAATEEIDSASEPLQEGHLVLRHSGVLGLAALVEAYPYTVPDWLPEVVDELSGHLNDPAPINATVKKTISEFKRTHHDNWREHKLKFTEDQLTTLSELDVSPSYYA